MKSDMVSAYEKLLNQITDCRRRAEALRSGTLIYLLQMAEIEIYEMSAQIAARRGARPRRSGDHPVYEGRPG